MWCRSGVFAVARVVGPYPERVVTFAGDVIFAVDFVLGIIGAILGVVVFLDAVTRRTDAFVAAERLTKPIWMGITGASGLLLVLGVVGWPRPQTLLWLAAMVGVLVYLVDVRPALRGLRGPSGW